MKAKWTRDRLERVLAQLPDPFTHGDVCRLAARELGSWSTGQGVILSAERLGLIFPIRTTTTWPSGKQRVSIRYTRREPYTDQDRAEAQALMGRLGMR